MTPPRITLQSIRDHSPCASGWTKLLRTLANPADMSITVSIGEIAKSNGPQDALWCLRCADFDRRDIIRAILPSVERAAVHTTDKRVADCITAIKGWLDGIVTEAELQEAAYAAADAACAAADAAAYAAYAAGAACAAADAAAYAAYAAADAAAYAAYAAADAAAYAADAACAACAADAAYAAYAAADAAAYAADAERVQQIEDIAAVFS